MSDLGCPSAAFENGEEFVLREACLPLGGCLGGLFGEGAPADRGVVGEGRKWPGKLGDLQPYRKSIDNSYRISFNIRVHVLDLSQKHNIPVRHGAAFAAQANLQGP